MTEQQFDYQQQAQEPTAENSVTPGAVAPTNHTQEKIQEVANDPLASGQDMQQLQERQAFETYVQSSGEAIPSNFKDAGAWFDSLKEAQKQYTQGQQEMADLKRTYADNNTQNPAYKPEVPSENPSLTEATGTEELRIPSPAERMVEEYTEDDSTLSEDDWNAWGMEVAINGDLSEETRAEIRAKGGFTDNMINDFLGAQKAKMREAYKESADIVGGREQLDNIFKWAADTLSYEEQVQINVGLSGPASELTLRGLSDMYNNSIGKTAKSKEPQALQGQEPNSIAQTGYVAYQTKREFYADRNNPRFNTDRAYRQAVEERMMRTDFNTLNP